MPPCQQSPVRVEWVVEGARSGVIVIVIVIATGCAIFKEKVVKANDTLRATPTAVRGIAHTARRQRCL